MEPEPTKLRLAQALYRADLPELAGKAERGDYDELESRSALPLTDLACDLAVAVTSGNVAAKAIREALIRGEFDSTEDEYEVWYRHHFDEE